MGIDFLNRFYTSLCVDWMHRKHRTETLSYFGPHADHLPYHVLHPASPLYTQGTRPQFAESLVAPFVSEPMDHLYGKRSPSSETSFKFDKR